MAKQYVAANLHGIEWVAYRDRSANVDWPLTRHDLRNGEIRLSGLSFDVLSRVFGAKTPVERRVAAWICATGRNELATTPEGPRPRRVGCAVLRTSLCLLLVFACGESAIDELAPEERERLEALVAGGTSGSSADHRAGCDEGVTNDCVLAGMGMEREDEAAALVLYGRACEAGDGVGCWYQGNLVAQSESSDAETSATSAATLYTRGCELDHNNSCVALAFAHVHGHGVARDLDRAITLFEKACELGTACAHIEHYRAQL